MTKPTIWSSEDIAKATEGRGFGSSFVATGVGIDSRDLVPGDLFVALRDTRDGHDFADVAYGAGAAGVLASRPVNGPHVLVPDTLIALQRLGAAARLRAKQTRRAAVTGSVGKTSVTQAIGAALALAAPSHSSVKSFNNHIGVPLSLARMPIDSEFAVFEIGMNHEGEIRELASLVQPHVAIVTVVSAVHTEHFEDGEEGVARAKAEIFEGLVNGGTAILNRDGRWFGLLSSAARSKGAELLTFGTHPESDFQLQHFQIRPQDSIGTALLRGIEVKIRLRQTSKHSLDNALATILAVEALGAPRDAALQALAGLSPLDGRGAEHTISTENGHAVLVDESYNASPISVRAALSTLGRRVVKGRRIVVLTDMLELGDGSDAAHTDLAGDLVAAEIDLLFASGPAMRLLYEAVPSDMRGGWFATATDLANNILGLIRRDDVVLVKGSHASHASQVANTLRSPSTAPKR